MTNPINLRTLFAPAFAASERTAARAAWSRQVVADLARANARVDAAWERRLADHPDADDEELDALPSPPEQAEAEAFIALITTALDRDLWPESLYWGSL